MSDAMEATDSVAPKQNKWHWLVWSLALAAGALGFEYLALIVQKPQPSQIFLAIGVMSTVGWVVLLIFTAFRLRRQSLWLLISAPIALLGPAYVAGLIIAIEVGDNECVAREQHELAVMQAANPRLDTKTLLLPPCGPDLLQFARPHHL